MVVRLHVVSGKGGTGKTTVAGALALALAQTGQRVLLMEVEGRQGIARLFAHPPLPHAETSIMQLAGGGEIFAMSVDAETALIEYLELFYKLGRAAGLLRRVGAVEFATTIAPGVKDVLLTGKIKEMTVREDRSRKGGRAYDAIILDAPPTGRITRFLNVTEHVGGLAKVGPVKSQADGVMQVLQSEMTQVHLVTLLEEMPVQETSDAVAELRAEDFPLGTVVVNAVRTPLLDAAHQAAAVAGDVDLVEIKAGLVEAGLDTSLTEVLADDVVEHARRVALEQATRADVDELGLPTVTLPLVDTGVSLTALQDLAQLIREQGMV